VAPTLDRFGAGRPPDGASGLQTRHAAFGQQALFAAQTQPEV